ncbi:MAG: hypothetical protein R3304_11470 [Longimicrobiales bacterium]|nr:hypothetical protein [Longimicrobiales bacterium]
MDDGTQDRGGSREGLDANGDPYEVIDSNLTVFALANGLDLSKADGHRTLEWFSEGLERGVVIDTSGDGFRVRARTWRSSRPDVRAEALVAEDLSPEALRPVLEEAVEAANRLMAPGPEKPPS